MAANKAPSEGTKVTTTTATKTENPGVVPSDSLADQSARAGGGFAENPRPNTTSGNQPSSLASDVSGQGAEAPTYVASQYARDMSKPHGRNITEVGPDGWDDSKVQDGTQKAMQAEVGSVDDPGRAAFAGAGMVGRKAPVQGAGVEGKKGGEANAQQGSAYEVLGESEA